MRMSKFLNLGCLLFLLAFIAGDVAQGEVVVIPIHGEISGAQFFFLRRALKVAEEKKADAVIIDMDTYGGRIDAAQDMDEALSQVTIPTYTYIDTNAGSAGALIAIATRKIYMAPVSAVGAAAPVTTTGGDLPSTMGDKVMSYFTAFFRSVATQNGHNPDIAEAFMNKDVDVKIGDTVIHPKGSLLSFSSQDAIRVVSGKPVFAAGIAGSMADLAQKEKLQGPVVTIEPTGFEVVAQWIGEFSILILGLGIVLAYLEIKLHGTFVPGIFSAICFLVFFAGQYIAGLAGWEVLVVFSIGLLLILSELFVHPGTIFPGIAGVILIFGSLLWAMVDRYPDQPIVPTSQMLVGPILTLGGAILAAVVAIYFLGKHLPTTPFLNRLALKTANPQGTSLSANSPDSPLLVKVGETGVAKSNLRPSGKAEFGDALVVDVITQGEFVAPYSRVRIIAIEGPRIVVESC